jgi:DNA-directed RNA polymerase subunit M/transcription elongation factor TFIIS
MSATKHSMTSIQNCDRPQAENLREHDFACKKCGEERVIWAMGHVVSLPKCSCGGEYRRVFWEQIPLL